MLARSVVIAVVGAVRGGIRDEKGGKGKDEHGGKTHHFWRQEDSKAIKEISKRQGE